jgi:hypothetical protein
MWRYGRPTAPARKCSWTTPSRPCRRSTGIHAKSTRHTREVHQAYIFFSVLAASNYTYAEATWARDLGSRVGGHCLTFKFIRGKPEVAVPDNPTSRCLAPALTNRSL